MASNYSIWFLLLSSYTNLMDSLLIPLNTKTLKGLKKSDLITLVEGEQSIRGQLEAENSRLRELCGQLEEQKLEIAGKFVRLRHRLFGQSSEARPACHPKAGRKRSPPKRNLSRSKKPSDRYPNLPVIEKEIEFDQVPSCSSCTSPMEVSQLQEVSEELTVIPRKYHITRYYRRKYRCGSCYGSLVTAPPLPRIIPGSAYSDELVIDVALSKYCDLIPMERYAAMARRQGVDGLPPNSLISLTHKLADFLLIIYLMLMKEVLRSDILRCDESPHRMLEGDEKSNWFLWQFAATGSIYFECHDTRSSRVSSQVLLQSAATALLTDDYSGYGKSVREANEDRVRTGLLPPIQHALCNAHCRRKFVEAELTCEEAEFFISEYGKIYHIEAAAKELSDSARLEIRTQAKPVFEKMLTKAQDIKEKYSSKSSMKRALSYFISNYQQLVLYLNIAALSIDNNDTERPMRSPAVGKKTWFGTHSRRGANTLAILFSIIESCKINDINPREYIPAMVARKHQGQEMLTPKMYKLLTDTS